MTQHRLTAYERVMQRAVRTERGCLEYHGATNVGGYGTLSQNDVMVLAHRVVYAFNHGPIPINLNVLHRCDNPPCVDDSHLFVGTQADNMADKVAKGRATPNASSFRHGVANPHAKLSTADVEAIRARRASGEEQAVIAHDFGISQSHVSSITLGKYRVRG